MYLWVGINVEEQLENIREKSKLIENRIGFKNSNFTLPLHISLKMSFLINDKDYNLILNEIANIYKNTKPFLIETKGIECEDVICWIKMCDNEMLNELQYNINTFLLNTFGIPLHEYDTDKKFHTTLFMENDYNKISNAYNLIKDINVPKLLIANKFVIAMSQTGALGTYKIIKEIVV